MRLLTTFREWHERRPTHLRPSTHRGYGECIEYWIVPQLGDLELDELDRRLIEQAYNRLLEGGARDGGPLAPRTVQYAAAVLHRALEGAVIDGLIVTNPAAHARRPNHNPAVDVLDEDPQVWTGEQVRTFLAFPRWGVRYSGALRYQAWDWEPTFDTQALYTRDELHMIVAAMKANGQNAGESGFTSEPAHLVTVNLPAP